jgi:type I restriction enzyme S subunit
MKAVEEETGRLDATRARPWAEVRKGYTPFQEGDVLFAKITPCMENGKYALAKGLQGGRAAGSTEFHVLRPGPRIDAKFLLYFLFTPALRQVAKARMKGTAGQLRVPEGVLAEAVTPLPPVEEQRRIVEEIEKQLTRLEAGVAALKRVQGNLRRYRAAVLKAACEGRLVPTEAELARREGRPYEPASALLERIKAEKAKVAASPRRSRQPRTAAATLPASLPPLPEGWAWAGLLELGELDRGKSRHRPRDDQRLYGGPYPFVQTGDVRNSRGTIRAHSQTYSEFGIGQSRLWPAGTLCITIAANIAETGILAYPACFPDSVVGFVHHGHPDTTRFVEFSLRVAKERLQRFAPATAQKNINLRILRDLFVPVPPLAEQYRIVAEAERRLSLADELDRVVSANLHRATRLHQAVLQAAFSGSLVPNDATAGSKSPGGEGG